MLLLSAETYRAEDFVSAAKRMGIAFSLATDAPQTLAPAIMVDFGRPEQSAEAAASALWAAGIHPTSVVAPDQVTLPLAEALASRLGCSKNLPGWAERTTNKAAMREALDQAGLPQPPWAKLENIYELAEAVARLRPPWVLKPLSLSASRGVIRADDPKAAQEAASRIWRILEDDGRGKEPILIEGYIEGREVAVEALVHEGDFLPVAIFDKPDPLVGPYFEETIYLTPSRLTQAEVTTVLDLAAQAARALGLRSGPIHAELRLATSGPVLIEVAARPIGGRCSRAFRFGQAKTLEELILEEAVGAKPIIPPLCGAAGVMMLPIEHAGRLAGIEGQEQAASLEGICGVEITIPPGGRLEPLPEGSRYLGFLFAKGPCPDAVETALRRAHNLLRFHIVQSPPEEPSRI